MASVVVDYEQFKTLAAGLAVFYADAQPDFIALTIVSGGVTVACQPMIKSGAFALDFPLAVKCLSVQL